ncbi:kinase-like protein [Aspergillus piperis CBS 112811]|uniref:non-specific serine/threonine protein kinase n=1 Tax=Aspergillus piperis CBS 112811 TaxID=1448313 RepID=A0A8G1VR51_9EURO|nr:kinase-like protein [Aspergillus piperis CBS 112811]RAH62719.1 kinase-like protein [Aspergillus piperis CBS 112811]
MPPPQWNNEAVYWPEDGVENLEGYATGGYHPTYINDEFSNGRYRVVHKLGYGSYSTVWLAHDRKESRYVALKIMIADVSERSVESKILQHLQRGGDLTHPGRKYISSLHDQFSFKGPNGHHMCLVSEVAGCSVAESKENSPRFMFSLDIARAIAAQVTMGPAYMHSLGVGHGAPPIQSCAPAHAIIPMNLIIVPSDQVVNCRVKITDFGSSSFFFGKEPLELHTPTALLPPEAFFQEPPITPAADIWTLGCTLYDILGERPLSETWADDPDDVIGEMRPKLFLEENGSWNPNFNRIQTPEFRPLDRRLWQMGRGETPQICEFQEMEMASFKRLLEGMLAYEPLERVSAREAMESDFMLKWARPALLRLEG